ncbi:serine hydrolase [Brevibacterium senegalense]|uniref:serine hydrolase n=1 Tax=Brevibacterium senegalense TaxID=1033736 RepID=UPI0002DE147B|nr:serine hydrolase [Brevibacterium senegalense]
MSPWPTPASPQPSLSHRCDGPTHPTSVEGHAVTWSIAVVDLDTGQPLLTHDADRVLPTASMGKVLLLLEVLKQAEAGRLDLAAPLPIAPAHEVADSGLLHLFLDRTVTVEDACLLVAAVSDNLATNALADLCGLDAVRATGGDLGLAHTAFLDAIRDERGPQHPSAPSCGSARELAHLFALLHAGEAVSPTVSARVLELLAAGADTSMVAGGLHLDPLAHRDPDGGVLLRHKTGHDAGVRADAGVVIGPAAALSYAVLAQWSPDADAGPTPVRVAVEAHMRALGSAMLAHVLDD